MPFGNQVVDIGQIEVCREKLFILEHVEVKRNGGVYAADMELFESALSRWRWLLCDLCLRTISLAIIES